MVELSKIGGDNSDSNTIWLQKKTDFVKSLSIYSTDSQVSKIIIVMQDDEEHEYGLNARTAESTEFLFDETYSLIGLMGSASRSYITSLSAIRKVDCAVLEAELVANKAQFQDVTGPAFSEVEEEQNSWLPLITIILLVIAVIGLTAAIVAWLLQRRRSSSLFAVYDSNVTTKLPDDSEKNLKIYGKGDCTDEGDLTKVREEANRRHTEKLQNLFTGK